MSRMLIVAVSLAGVLSVIGCSWQDGESYAGRDQIDGPTPRVFTSMGQGVEPKRRFDLDGQTVVLQVVDREGIPDGATCQLRVMNRGNHKQAYVALWEHHRDLDQTSIVCRAKQFIDWRNTSGDYVVELIVDNRVTSNYKFTIGSAGLVGAESDQVFVSREASAPVNRVVRRDRSEARASAWRGETASVDRVRRTHARRRRFVSFRRMFRGFGVR